jgi:hypothetical protein
MQIGRRSFLSLLLWRLRGVASPCLASEYSCYLLRGYCNTGQVDTSTWKGALPPLFTQEVTVKQTSFCAVHTISAGGLDLGCRGVVICLHLCANFATAQRGQQLCLLGLATVIHQFKDLLGLRLVPSADSPGPGLPDFPYPPPFLHQCHRWHHLWTV